MGIKINLPKDWRAVSIGQFQQLTAVAGNRVLDQVSKDAEVISILTGIPSATLLSLPFSELLKLIKATAWISEPPTDTKLKAWKSDSFTRYRIVSDAREINAGQFITLNELTTNGVIDNLHQIIALLTVKERLTLRGWKREEQTAAEFEQRSALFAEKMPVSMAYPWALFFSQVLTAFLEVTQASLAKKQKQLKRMKKAAEARAAAGDGSE